MHVARDRHSFEIQQVPFETARTLQNKTVKQVRQAEPQLPQRGGQLRRRHRQSHRAGVPLDRPVGRGKSWPCRRRPPAASGGVRGGAAGVGTAGGSDGAGSVGGGGGAVRVGGGRR